ncbi:MAG: thiolase family protein [Deltaproteobacteria bacterium]|nr:thiolase family protein [Deltaproteobacteria bacterium]MBW2095864.1 thiolase family protein [Deltaproteobacteria bacterium]
MKPLNEMREVVVAGIGLVPWRRYEDQEIYDFGSEAVLNALKDADMEWRDIQAAFCGSVYQGTCSGHQVLKEIGLSGIPIVNVENACSSGASAVRLAYQSVAAEIHDVALAVGFEKMPRGPIPSTAFRPYELKMGFNFQPANYANEAVEYMTETGATVEDFSLVTVKNRKNGALNPNASFRKPVTLEEVMNSRMVARPLRLLHCCPLSDGAAAAVLCSRDRLKSAKRAVTVAASVLVSGVYGGANPVKSLKFPAPLDMVELSGQQAYELSGYGPEEMDVVQAYDTMAPSELWNLEKLGFCKKGKAPELLREGVFEINGRLPVNTDGGLISRGHPLGATSIAQIGEIVLQLRGEAGPRQVAGARIGLAHSRGAGPNSAVTILKR